MPFEFLVGFGFTILGSAVTGAVAWGAGRARLGRVEDDVKVVEADLAKHTEADVAQHTDIVQRLTRMETVLGRIDRRI